MKIFKHTKSWEELPNELAFQSSYFFFFKDFIEVQLIYGVVLVSHLQQPNSVTHVYKFFLHIFQHFNSESYGLDG